MNAGLAAALRAGASGICAQQASVELLIDHATFLERRDFIRFVEHCVSISDGVTAIASIDWPAVITALDAGALPCSSGERRMLKLAASLAGGVPVDLCDTITGLDEQNVSLVMTAVLRAAGQHQVTGRRQVSLDSVDATSIAVTLDSIETWLRRAPDDVIASLAGSAYGEPTPRALSWARDLISDLRYYSTVMSFAVRAADPEEQPPF